MEATRQRKKPIVFQEEFHNKPNSVNSITTIELFSKPGPTQPEIKRKRKLVTDGDDQQQEKQQPIPKKQKISPKSVALPVYENVDNDDLDNRFMMQCFLKAVATWMVTKDDFSFLSVFGGIHLRHYSSLEIIVEQETNRVIYMCLGTWCCHDDRSAGENCCSVDIANTIIYDERVATLITPIPVTKVSKMVQ